MGDRTNVTLWVPTELSQEAEAILEKHDGSPGEEVCDNEDGTTMFEFSEVNYGDLSSETALVAAGIPFEKLWGNGNEYSSGRLYNRYTETGEHAKLEVYDKDINPQLDELMALIDKPDELVAFIQAHHDGIQPLPMANQIEYGKRYVMRQLVEPK